MISDLCGMIGEIVWPCSGFGSCNHFLHLFIASSKWWKSEIEDVKMCEIRLPEGFKHQISKR